MSMTEYYKEQSKHTYVAFKKGKNEKKDEQYVLYNRQTLQVRKDVLFQIVVMFPIIVVLQKVT